MKHVLQQQAGEQNTAGGAAAAKVRFCDKSWDDAGVVYFKFGNGQQVEIDTNKCPAETQLDLRCHGAAQKGGDSFAGVKGNYAQAIENVQAIRDQLYAGEWNAGREGGPRLQELAEAIARIKGVDVDRARAAVEKASDDERAAWRSNAGVKHAMAQIKAERAAAALQSAGEQPLNVNFS